MDNNQLESREREMRQGKLSIVGVEIPSAGYPKTTPTGRTHRPPHARSLPAVGLHGMYLGFKLAVPYHLGAGGPDFAIGHVRFRLGRHNVMALDPIPDSWYVDLSTDIEEAA